MTLEVDCIYENGSGNHCVTQQELAQQGYSELTDFVERAYKEGVLMGATVSMPTDKDEYCEISGANSSVFFRAKGWVWANK